MAMDTEEMIRAQPIDGVVLLAGCDKTTPAQLMGAVSADLPAIMVTGGPMLTGRWRGRDLGACTDCRRLWTEYRAGTITQDDIAEVEGLLFRSHGHCTVMGTASSMASIAEALGMTLPHNAAIPAPDSGRLRHAEDAGRRIVHMVNEGLRPSAIVTREAIENAIRVLLRDRRVDQWHRPSAGHRPASRNRLSSSMTSTASAGKHRCWRTSNLLATIRWPNCSRLVESQP